ncbi:MAG: PLP-dependent aminotransferase family protein, partial [Clostridia bacterium]|nr:PLP-dependent aminotransferase family protein [Clostridia bacterium]
MEKRKDKKYEHLYRQMKTMILTGEYVPNQKLPSKRVLADMSGYSPVTVSTAYEMLEQEGYVEARERSGYYVCSLEHMSPEQSKARTSTRSHLSVPQAEHPGEGFEYSVWFKTIRKVLTDYERELFVKSPSAGCAVLRNAISDYLYRYRGMEADPARIVVGSGAEQLYESVVKLLGRERVYGVENPCYEQIKAVYFGAGVRLCELPMGEDGIRSESLQQTEADVLHVTPFHSYPTGVTANASKRYEYLRWAEKTGRFLVEDDFDSEFFMPGHPIESLYALDQNDSVIYINTFSKSLSPSMRMGYMILPRSLLPIYDRVMGGFSCSVPVLDQYILAEFIASGNFERHLNRMRRKMKA